MGHKIKPLLLHLHNHRNNAPDVTPHTIPNGPLGWMIKNCHSGESQNLGIVDLVDKYKNQPILSFVRMTKP